MLKNKILVKVLAIILIFTLTSTNFAFVSKAYAAGITEVIFGEKSDTGSKNVGFDAYFQAEDEKITSAISDVKNKNLAISMDLSVEDSGYLKNAEVKILEAKENEGLNFKLKGFEEKPEYVQGLEDNTLKLDQIDSFDDVVSIKLPIEYKNEKYFDESNLSKEFVVSLNGTYIDNKGNEIEISKDIPLKLSWKDSREISVESEVEKYIDFGEGVVVQSKVTVSNETEENTLPVKETEITIDVPKYQGQAPSNVYVVANSTIATNGKSVGDVDFDESNWNYNEDENKLTINVSNEKETVVVNEYEDEFLQDTEKEVVEQERYYNLPGTDEYLVTYTYNDVESTEEPVDMDSEIDAKMTIFSGDEKEDNINIITNENKYVSSVEGADNSKTASLSIENETEKVSKSYFYANLNGGDYDIEFDSKTVLNVSYNEIIKTLEVKDEDNFYIDNEGKEYPTSDIYYKSLSISKDNFVEILGENGKIEVLDISGSLITTINGSEDADNDGNLTVLFNNNYSKIILKVSKPVGEGNLIISNKKAISSLSISKQFIESTKYLLTKTSISADYDYVEDNIDMNTVESRTELLDTETRATLVMDDRDSLSTLSVNEDVKMRIELNNDKEGSDLYGHSEFEIVLPDRIEEIKIKEPRLLNEEGLSLTSIDVVDNVIKVVVDGKQTALNSSTITNGTNITFQADIKVNIFTPSISDVMTLKINNSEATNYSENGESELRFNYSAPSGLVAVNRTYNYSNSGSSVMSVKQGRQAGILDVYSASKYAATMEILVMNNNKNSVSDFSILGRFPFVGVKDILTEDDLGTTITPKILKGIEADENNADFDVYYSNKEDATKELNEENGWDTVLTEESKSYLIVPKDENYIMEQYEVLKFSYEYEIPENLQHNENIFGTFAAYYTNISEVAITRDVESADLVGVTTGAGPVVSLEVKVNKTEIKESEELQIKLIAKNDGKDLAEDVVVELPIPENSKFDSILNDNEEIEAKYDENNKKVTVTIPEIEAGESEEVTVCVTANKFPLSSDIKESSIDAEATITAKDLNAVLSAKSETVVVEEAELEITETEKIGARYVETYIEGNELTYTVTIRNITSDLLTNVIATKELPKELELIKAYSKTGAGEVKEASYDSQNKIITWNIGDLDADSLIVLKIEAKVGHLDDSLTEKKVVTSTTVTAANTSVYESNSVSILVGRPVLVINQETDNTNTYVTEGSTINYKFSIKNTGSAKADNVILKEMIPEGINVKSITYSLDGLDASKNATSKTEAIVKAVYISPESELVVNVRAVAAGLNGVQEKTVTNYAYVSADGINEVETNSITHIIEASPKNQIDNSESSSHSRKDEGGSTGSTSQSSDITKTYKISGMAWLDENKDGIRDANEQTLTGIIARLVNNDTGEIIKSISTDSMGSYTFIGVENGNYFIIFDYDTVKYGVTDYQKSGAAANVNSDASPRKIEQDGKSRNAAITEVIRLSNGSISNIDIGLVLADTFDLKIDKTITKVTVISNNGTTTNNYDNVKLAKTEIAAKHLAGATVYVEYAITVTNVGDIAGYAKKIVDYIPNGMSFGSTLGGNSSWYTGSNGDLYTEELANRELVKGESATVKLVLTRKMNAENTDIVNNKAEIYEDFNKFGVSDINSEPANKAQGENDLSSADIAIMVKTGETFLNISVVMMTLLLITIVAFVVFNKIVEIKRRKEGV